MNLHRPLWLIVLLPLLITSQALAARGGGRGGHGAGHAAHSRPSGQGHFFPGRFTGSIAAPFFWAAYPIYPYYSPLAYPPVGVVPVPPAPLPVDAQAPLQTTESAAGYWYFCPSSQTYFPYVQQCAEPWQQMAPQPTPPAAGAEPAAQ